MTSPDQPVVLMLRSEVGQGWPEPILEDHIIRSVDLPSGTKLEDQVAAAVRAIEDLDIPMHVVASGPDGAVAVRVAVTRPDLVKSLILADCNARTRLGDVTDDLPNVAAPTLVVAASPGGEDELEESQTLAGQIPNGVFVVMDDVPVPAHGSRPGSFSAWSTSFISIVDGLDGLDPQTA